jgi:hypothetical protein
MDKLQEQIEAQKAELETLRPLSPGGLSNLEHIHDIELTYTSNAIEGNTLTAAETSLVVGDRSPPGGLPVIDKALLSEAAGRVMLSDAGVSPEYHR